MYLVSYTSQLSKIQYDWIGALGTYFIDLVVKRTQRRKKILFFKDFKWPFSLVCWLLCDKNSNKVDVVHYLFKFLKKICPKFLTELCTQQWYIFTITNLQFWDIRTTSWEMFIPISQNVLPSKISWTKTFSSRS